MSALQAMGLIYCALMGILFGLWHSNIYAGFWMFLSSFAIYDIATKI